MCGLAGFVNSKLVFKKTEIDEILSSFKSYLKHRGPDADGSWKDEVNRVYLAHTRLSINDLSQNGSQPMCSENEKYALVFNGEIYNHLEIRKKYLNKFHINWKSRSDTETLLKCIELLGIKQSLSLFEGMFAFSVYSKTHKKLFLTRDKFGEKPLYYGLVGNSLVFGSELKIFSYFPGFNKKISNVALSLFLKYSYVPEPYSIFDNILKVNPGEVVEIDLKNLDFNKEFFLQNLTKYKWYQNNHIKNKIDNKNDVISNLDDILISSVKESLLSDVEVGTFLSGGLDSSLISSIAQKQNKNKIRTFSICFEDEDYNEQKYSRLVSDHIGSNHKEFMIKSFELSEYFEKLCDVYDEPFADSSQIPTLILSEFASKDVKVCLTGDGADELFGGYNRYLLTEKIKSKSKYVPHILKKLISSIVNNLNYKQLSKISKIINQTLLNDEIPQINEKLQKFGKIFHLSGSLIDMYLSLIEVSSNIKNPIFNYSNESDSFFLNDKSILESTEKDTIQDLMNLDKKFYLTGDILHKVDRAAMYYGLETRVPFLNSKVVNFSNEIDLHLKINNNQNKYILKQLAKKYIPDEIINRNKMGFSVPLDNWINKDSENMIGNLNKNKDFLINLGFNFDAILEHFEEHKIGKKNWSHLLWNLIIFNKWATKYAM